MIAHYPQRFRWRLDGPWRVYDERPESGAICPYLVEGDELAHVEEDGAAGAKIEQEDVQPIEVVGETGKEEVEKPKAKGQGHSRAEEYPV